MADPTLVVMAAGIGSRYGGLKQIDPIGPNGEIILDYSVYDALRAGFKRVVFIINRTIEEAFRQKIGRTVEAQVDTAYVIQDLTMVPEGFRVPAERKKPWGTGHAVLSARGVVHEPFAAINADDFYGAAAFQALAQHLRQARDEQGLYDFSMAGYRLSNTLSEHGYVARGICEVSADGFLTAVRERTRIEAFPDGIKYSEDGAAWVALPGDTRVSMNCWGFTPPVMAELEAHFERFLRTISANPLKAEYFLPDVVGDLLLGKKARVRVLPVEEKWFGVT